MSSIRRIAWINRNLLITCQSSPAERRSRARHRYLIAFDDGSMDHIPEADLTAVGESARAVVREAKAAGVWIFGGGVLRQQSSIVATDGTISGGPVPEAKAVIGGFSIIEVSSREEKRVWAARVAQAGRSVQEGRGNGLGPEA